MTVAEAIIIQREFVANKYDKNTSYPNYKLKESMKILTKAYDDIWEFLMNEHQEVLDEFLMKED